MRFSRETEERINRFAKEQSQHYLDAAEMTYMEKLRRKTGQTQQKIGRKLSRFKGSPDQAREAQNDMILYMSDYMNDLIANVNRRMRGDTYWCGDGVNMSWG